MGTKENLEKFRDAKRRLDNCKAKDANDPEYQRLNREVDEAMKKVPWPLRW